MSDYEGWTIVSVEDDSMLLDGPGGARRRVWFNKPSPETEPRPPAEEDEPDPERPERPEPRFFVWQQVDRPPYGQTGVVSECARDHGSREWRYLVNWENNPMLATWLREDALRPHRMILRDVPDEVLAAIVRGDRVQIVEHPVLPDGEPDRLGALEETVSAGEVGTVGPRGLKHLEAGGWVTLRIPSLSDLSVYPWNLRLLREDK